MREALGGDIQDLKTNMGEKESQVQEIEGQMRSIKDSVREMVDLFKVSKFFLSVASNMQYDEDTQFNENNVTIYLSELEEYISLLITFMAYR